METSSSSNFPANYVSLNDLKERWLKRKQDEEEANLRKLRAEEEEEKLRKLRQEEEEEEKLRKLRQEEKEQNKSRKPKEEWKPTPRSKRPSRPARKYASSPGASASRDQRCEKRAEWFEKKTADEAKVSEAIGDKYDSPPPIAGRRNARNRGSVKHGIHPTPRASQSFVKIEEKKAEKQEKKIESSGKEQTSEIIRRVKNIAIAGANDRPRMRKELGKGQTVKMLEKKMESPKKGPTEKKLESSGKEPTAEIIQRGVNTEVAGGSDVRRGRASLRGRASWRGGGGGGGNGNRRRSRLCTSDDGMVWVRKTPDA